MWYLNPVYLWIFFIGIITLVYRLIQNRFSYWAKIGVPYKKPHWFYGNFKDAIKSKISMGQLIAELYNEFKNEKYGGVWNLYTPNFIAVDETLIGDILVKDFSSWSQRGSPVNTDVDPLSGHLVNLNGKKWKSVRAKLTPTFTSGKLKQMHYLLLECAKDLEKYLEIIASNDGLVEAREMSARFTTDVVGSCAFGIQMNSLKDEDALFRKMGRKIFEPSFRKKIARLLQFNFETLFKLLKVSLVDRDVTEFFLRITKENLEYREKNNVQRNDFMDLIRSLKNTSQNLDEDEIEFDDKLLAAQAFVFFAAGFETSSTVISYCLHELAFNEEIQNRLRDEVHKTKADSNGEITWDGLKNMKYLNMVLQETMRKYPPIPWVRRTSVKPYKIPDTNIELPSGTQCIISIYGLHRDPEHYPDPEKFDPERFNDDAIKQRSSFTFLPFGSGPRNCIGSRFAEQQTKIAIVTLIDNFRISITEKSQNPLKLNPKTVFLIPKDGIWIRIEKIASTV